MPEASYARKRPMRKVSSAVTANPPLVQLSPTLKGLRDWQLHRISRTCSQLPAPMHARRNTIGHVRVSRPQCDPAPHAVALHLASLTPGTGQSKQGNAPPLCWYMFGFGVTR